MILFRKKQITQEVIIIEDKIYLRENISQYNATEIVKEKTFKPAWYTVFNETRTKCSRYKSRKLEKEYLKIAENK